MTDREKLVNILKTEACPYPYLCDEGCRYASLPRCFEERYADHLLANGVVVLPLQVGDTVYGRFSSRGNSVHECRVINNKLCQFKDGSVHNFLEVEFDIIDPYYNDGRLMRCWHQAVYGEDFGSWDRVYLTREEAETQLSKEGE